MVRHRGVESRKKTANAASPRQDYTGAACYVGSNNESSLTGGVVEGDIWRRELKPGVTC